MQYSTGVYISAVPVFISVQYRCLYQYNTDVYISTIPVFISVQYRCLYQYSTGCYISTVPVFVLKLCCCFSTVPMFISKALLLFLSVMMRPGLNRFYPAYSRDITPLGRPHPVYPGAVRPIGMNPLYGINSAGGGATLIRLMDGRKMLIPSAEGAARGQRAMLMTRDSAIAGATPVSPSVAAHLHRMIAPTIGHNQFRVMGFLSERATHMIFKASPRTPLVRTLNSFSGRFL